MKPESKIPRWRSRAALHMLIATSVTWGLGACCSGASPRSESHAEDESALILSHGWQLQDVAKVREAGEVISQVAYEPLGWHRATVPGTVLTSLVNEGIYPEPLYGENNRPDRIPESLCRTSYWYRTQFRVPNRYANRRVWLNLEGINYTADIWINGRPVGVVQGAFARGNFDITDFAPAGELAAVAVLVHPPPHPGDPVEQTIANGTGLNGGVLAADGPTFLCTVGWDWIPGIRDRNMGIWRGVSVSATGPVRLKDPVVTSDLPLPRTDTADLTIETTVQNVTDSAQTGLLHGTLDASEFRVPVTLGPHETRTIVLTPATTPELHVLHPRLWWPNGYGPQNLNALHLRFDVGGRASDVRKVTFGIREIGYEAPGSENLTLIVNGVPVIAKGGNWGMDEAMKRIPRERLEAQIRMHQQAHYTMIRNWVGQSTSEDFYELCDQYGLLVWDEFFQPNPSDGPDPVDADLYLANVREKVLRFRQHPSIALWCGRNEGDPAPPAIDTGVARIMSELDPLRLYQRNSSEGRGVRSSGPYSWRPPRRFYDFPSDEAFKTEIGSVSIPTLEAVKAMLPEKDWDTKNDAWAEHDLAYGAQEGRDGPLYHDMLSLRYGAWQDLAGFVRRAQLANYEAFRAMYEGRFAKLFAPSTGVLTWMSNPAQPSFVWQLYSHDLEPNASLFAVQKACEPVHVQMNQNDFHLMVVNATPRTLEGLEIEVRVFNLDGNLKYERKTPVVAHASAATDAGKIAWPPEDSSPVHFIRVTLHDAQGRLLSHNFYWRALPLFQDDFRALDMLPRVPLDTGVVRHDAVGKTFLDVSLTNRSAGVALMSHLQLRKQRSGERVLPVYYSDNYISLVPGETRTITIEAATKDLHGEVPLVLLDGWNVTTANQVFPGPNGGTALAVHESYMGAK